MWLVLLLVFVSWSFYRLLKFLIFDPWSIHRSLWSQGIPGRYIPVVGEILHIRKSIHAEDPFAYGLSLEAKFGDYYHTSFGPIVVFHTHDPALINGVLKTNARAYHKTYIMRTVIGTILGNKSLLVSEDKVHDQHRRMIAPAFQHKNVNSMISLIVEVTMHFMKKWSTLAVSSNHKSLVLDIREEMVRLTLNTISSCVFGTEIISNEKLHETMYRNVFETIELARKRMFNMTSIIPIINRLPLPNKRHIDRSLREGNEIIRQIVDDRKKGLTKSTCKGPDLLDLLLAARDDDNTSKLTDAEVNEEALTVVFAGHETTSSLMEWTLFNLANNPDVYRRLEAEIDSIMGDNEEITASTLSLLTYTEAVLKETLRLHQPIPTVGRTAVKDNTLIASDGKKIHIKKGTDVQLNYYILHHSEKYWHDPFKFDPSRFDGNQMEKLIFPFSAGPRSCIGQNFAMLEAKIMLALIIRRFHFELEPGQKYVPNMAVILRPKYGMPMRVSPRQHT